MILRVALVAVTAALSVLALSATRSGAAPSPAEVGGGVPAVSIPHEPAGVAGPTASADTVRLLGALVRLVPPPGR